MVIPVANHQEYTVLDLQRAYNDGFSNGHAIGYGTGLQEGLQQGPAHPAVQESVARMFDGWDGADNARQRSTQRFWNDYRAHRRGGDRHD